MRKVITREISDFEPEMYGSRRLSVFVEIRKTRKMVAVLVHLVISGGGVRSASSGSSEMVSDTTF